MRIQITARHCEIPEDLRRRTDARLRKLTRYDPRLSAASVRFELEKHVRRAEAILSVDREGPVVAHGEGQDFREAADQLLDRLARILRRRRSQVTDRKVRGPRPIGALES